MATVRALLCGTYLFTAVLSEGYVPDSALIFSLIGLTSDSEPQAA